jgi:hypothetical protein
MKPAKRRQFPWDLAQFQEMRAAVFRPELRQNK